MSDVTAVFAYSHLNTAIDQRERAYYPNYFINHSEERCEATLLPCSQEKNSRLIGHFGKYHNTLCLSPKYTHCFCFLLGPLKVPRETGNNAYAKFGGTNKEYYGIFQSGLWKAKSSLLRTCSLGKTIRVHDLVQR